MSALFINVHAGDFTSSAEKSNLLLQTLLYLPPFFAAIAVVSLSEMMHALLEIMPDKFILF